jgi:hypothetical protein
MEAGGGSPDRENLEILDGNFAPKADVHRSLERHPTACLLKLRR